VIEFFCGIGGVSEAIRQINVERFDRLPIKVARAIDIDEQCAAVHEHNFDLHVDRRTIESLNLREFSQRGQACTWWMSPPCQPYCRRGRNDPLSDRRCDAIRSITKFLASSDCLPTALLLENVPEFVTSWDAANLMCALHDRGFVTWDGELCPTQWGIPNLRRRYYLIARRDAKEIQPPVVGPRDAHWVFPVRDVLEPNPSPELLVDPAIVDAYANAMDIIEPADPESRAACFGSGYGKSIIRSGSYVREGDRVRRFSPREVARLLGYSESFGFPQQFSTRQRWKMLGNSVSIFVVKKILAVLTQVS
jgi:site-specific DNA-cytosine methylase